MVAALELYWIGVVLAPGILVLAVVSLENVYPGYVNMLGTICVMLTTVALAGLAMQVIGPEPMFIENELMRQVANGLWVYTCFIWLMAGFTRWIDWRRAQVRPRFS